jgi:hypothetical protein
MRQPISRAGGHGLRNADRSQSLRGRDLGRYVGARALQRPAPTGVGGDVEKVIRRGLAKSNRQRFDSITEFSDALCVAAAGRLRETQWAATLAYAASEVASHDSNGRSGRRLRRLALAAAVAASIAIAFLVGGKANRRSSPVPAPASGKPREARQDDIQPRAAAVEATDGPLQVADAADAAQPERAKQPEIIPLPAVVSERPSPIARDKRQRNRWTAPPAIAPPSVSPSGPGKEDWTMPPSETE